MDVQRVILISALALITYLIVLQWNNDYNQPPQIQTEQATISAYSGSPQSEIPQIDTTQASGDVPSSVTETVVPTAAAQAEQTQFINIRTDVLDLTVDARGGDIIRAALLKHKALIDSDLPFVLLEQTNSRVYVAQSGLVGRDGPDANPEGRPLFSSQQTSYEMGDQERLTVDLNYVDDKGVEFIKRFTFTRGSYNIEMNYLVNNQSDTPFQGILFGQLKRDNTSDPTSSSALAMSSYLGAVFSTADSKYKKVTFKDMDKGAFREVSPDGWVAMLQHYFLSAWIPSPGAEYTYLTRKVNNQYIAGFLSPSFDVMPGQSTEVSANLFVGPKDQEQLEATAQHLKLTVDYGWLWWIAYPLYWLLTFIQGMVGNWGLAIIGITVVVKLALFHLNAKAFRSMAKMRKFGPEMMRMKELYGDDRQKMSQEMMKLYQREKINPLGGCLPILAQMPVFIALYWVLMESVELRHAPFFGYIQDLSVMDPYFILPILMGITMFLQQKLNPTPPDPMQAKIMKMLPIIFTFFFLWFPAGLVLYWLVNNVLSIAQQYVITKQIEKEDIKPAKG